ncbi:HAMP domain-containing sensor histidine kinase [Temperatibacter marinus]|uniref:histidine kinase n=1 Tax=Temperatibacter marinus TaxID=1456591 RepID=A0AA52EAX9_9PROT|nr:HAMP domain-containing sensor histidine kinase [Temperatibacter marinus]WND01486.1 HAMP domain-containing sensor histidine kinase [Temperatibacter marinus]
MIEMLKILSDEDQILYKKRQKKANSRYSFASSITLFLILLVVSYPHLYTVFIDGAYHRYTSFSYATIFITYLFIYLGFSLLFKFYRGRYLHALSQLLMLAVLSMTFILGVMDVLNDQGTMAFALGALFVVSVYSMSILGGLIFYTLYLALFYLVVSSQGPFNYFAEYIALIGLTLLLSVVMEVNRQRQFRDRLLIRKQVRELREKNDQLEDAMQLKDKFISQISHDFKTPLNAILGFSGFLKETTVNKLDYATIEEYGRYINDSGNHLLSLINNLLLLNKNKAGKLNPKISKVEMTEVINHCVSVVNIQATAKSQILAVRISDTIPTVQTDKLMLSQILLNIVSNAVKYTPDGGTIYLSCDHLGERLVFKCMDSGVGMDDEEVKHALQPFNQIESHLSDGSEGTGLGLPIVVELCDLLAIDFTVYSNKDEGTTVTLEFPI